MAVAFRSGSDVSFEVNGEPLAVSHVVLNQDCHWTAIGVLAPVDFNDHEIGTRNIRDVQLTVAGREMFRGRLIMERNEVSIPIEGVVYRILIYCDPGYTAQVDIVHRTMLAYAAQFNSEKKIVRAVETLMAAVQEFDRMVTIQLGKLTQARPRPWWRRLFE